MLKEGVGYCAPVPIEVDMSVGLANHVLQESAKRSSFQGYSMSSNKYRKGLGGGFNFCGVIFPKQIAPTAIGLIGEYAVSSFLNKLGCSAPDLVLRKMGDAGYDLMCKGTQIEVKTRYPKSAGKGWHLTRCQKGSIKQVLADIYVFCTVKKTSVLINGWLKRKSLPKTTFVKSFAGENFNLKIDDCLLESPETLINYLKYKEMLNAY
jgi:hypothetical protein